MSYMGKVRPTVALTSSDIVDGAVTATKIGDDAVTTAKIVDVAVTDSKVANAINTSIAANTAKVTNATHTGDVTGATALTIAAGAVETAMVADDAVTPAKMADSAFLANRNMIINGAMQIHQRGTTVAGGTSNLYSPLDRWGLGSGSSFNFDVTATTNTTTVNTEDGFASALMITPDSTQTPTGSHNATIFYRLEGFDCQRLQQGGADAHSFTLSFYAKAVNKTGVYSVQCIKKDAAGNGRYQVKEYTLTTSWVRQEITFEPDTNSLIRNSKAEAMAFYFSLACGVDDIVAPTTAWAANGGIKAGTNQVNFMASTSNEFHITGVQLEIGRVATPYEHKTYGQELAACQRYYSKSYNADVAPATSGAVGACSSLAIYSTGSQSLGARWVTSMRSAPTVVIYPPGSTNTGYVQQTSNNAEVAATAGDIGMDGFQYLSGSLPNTAANGVRFHWSADAELQEL